MIYLPINSNTDIIVSQYLEMLNHLYRFYNKSSKDFYKKNMCSKINGKNRGQWGYYCSRNIYQVLLILKEYKITSLIDLGSGPGIFLHVLSKYTLIKNLLKQDYLGFEIEPKLVKASEPFIQYSSVRIVEKDILTITTEDIKNHQAFYIYEPFVELILRKKFFDNLINISKIGQIIIYFPASNYFEILNKDLRLKRLNEPKIYNIRDREVYIYKVINKK